MNTYPKALGVHLLPATGEWAYDTVPYVAAQRNFSNGTLDPPASVNTNYAPGGSKTDYSYALDQLQAAHPDCETVSVVCAWFFNSEDASACQLYPSSIYLLGEVWRVVSGVPVPSHWMVSGLTEQNFPGIIPIPTTSSGSYVYGGTPSDPSIVRCIQDLKARAQPALIGWATAGPRKPIHGKSPTATTGMKYHHGPQRLCSVVVNRSHCWSTT